MRWFLRFFTAALIICIGDAEEGDPPIGAAMNLLDQFGILVENIRVMRLWRFHADNFEVPTVKILKNPPHVLQANGDSVLGSDLRLDFCDNVEQLLKWYCRGYEFEGVEKPWNVFTSFSKSRITAQLFGTDEGSISDDYSYVVLSISRYRDGQELAGSPENLECNKNFVGEAEIIAVGDQSSFFQFINTFGTHYIHSFVTGDSLYQIFVYKRAFYENFKELYETPNSAPKSTDLLNEYLSPEHALSIGAISAVSGNPVIEEWAENNMEVKNNDGTYKSLFAVVRNETLSTNLKECLDAGNAVLELELRSLAPFIKDSSRRQFFEELLSNHLILYEANI